MFTGIVKTIGILQNIEVKEKNYHFHIQSDFSNQLKIDQSVAHNGVCLTVVSVTNNSHEVVAVAETLQKTNLSSWTIGERINLERGLLATDRLDGHLVQGHVDGLAKCESITDELGSYKITFKLIAPSNTNLIIEKGSIAVNGVSLTAFHCTDTGFCVAIIPYTWLNTTFADLQVGTIVNIEFEIIGKYVRQFTVPYNTH